MKMKLLALALAIVMCISLTACGGKNNAGQGQTGTSDSSKEKESFTVLDVEEEQRISDIEITGMKMGKEEYAVSETITVTVDWNGTPADDTWIGIIPADIPHGSEEKNDEFDIDYRYFADMKSGDTFTFENVTLEPGDYTMRINEYDSGGVELAWCGFTVE